MPLPSYGLDAPPVVRNLLIAAGALIVTAAWLPALWIPGLSILATAAYMIWGSLVGKRQQRERLLDRYDWQGGERVLDIGCGRGLLVVGAAHRLTKGKAVGIDIWQSADLSGNGAGAVLRNAASEEVIGRAVAITADMRDLPFPDASFDVIVSSLAIHNVPDDAGRRRALAEIVRVLKPGGQVFLQDIHCTASYVIALKELGLTQVERSGPQYRILPWPRIVSGRKAS